MLKSLFLVLSIAAFISCEKEPTPGPQGPQGPAGVDSSANYYFTQGVAGYNGEISANIRNGTYVNNNYGNGVVVSMGWSYSHVVRGLLKVDISSIKNKVLGNSSTEQECLDKLVVNDALVYMKQGLPENSSTIWIYALKDTSPQFVPAEVTWNKASNSANWTSGGASGDANFAFDNVVLSSSPAFSWRSFRITRSIAKNWICSPAKNKGMLFKAADESDAGFFDKTTSLITGNSSEDQRPIFFFNVTKYDASAGAGKTENLPLYTGKEIEPLNSYLGHK